MARSAGKGRRRARENRRMEEKWSDDVSPWDDIEHIGGVPVAAVSDVSAQEHAPCNRGVERGGSSPEVATNDEGSSDSSPVIASSSAPSSSFLPPSAAVPGRRRQQRRQNRRRAARLLADLEDGQAWPEWDDAGDFQHWSSESLRADALASYGRQYRAVGARTSQEDAEDLAMALALSLSLSESGSVGGSSSASSSSQEPSYEALVQLEGVPRVLPQEQLAALPVMAASCCSGLAADELCSICQSQYLPEEAVLQLPCRHVFHRDCAAQWLAGYSRRCPICKADCERQQQGQGAGGEEEAPGACS